MRVLPGPTKSNQVLAWSPDGRFVAAGGNGDGVTVWDVDAGTPGLRVLRGAHGGEAMTFCPRTGRLYVAFRAGGFWTYDPDAGAERRRLPSDRSEYACPAVSADGRTLVLRRYYFNTTPPTPSPIVGYAVGDDGALAEVWSRPSEENSYLERRFEFTFRPGTDQLFGIRGPWRAQTFAWERAATGEPVGSFPLVPSSGNFAQWVLAPDGERVAWLAEQTLYLLRLGEPAPRVVPAPPGEFRRGLAWAPHGRTLAYGTGATVRLLDADTLTEAGAFDWGTGKVRAIAFSPDGLRAAVSADAGRGWVTVFDLE